LEAAAGPRQDVAPGLTGPRRQDAMTPSLRLHALERDDLKFVHDLNNNRGIMAYWFEEPYESFVELEELYLKHIHDLSERRFIAWTSGGERIGLVELVEITYIHRRAEFQVIVAPEKQGAGFGQTLTRLALDYAFRVLNLNKLYLSVSTANAPAIAIYEKCGFKREGQMVQEFFVNGRYQDALRMYRLQQDFLREDEGFLTSEPVPQVLQRVAPRAGGEDRD
jgi:diamine N-acetyltransferase